jgi:hypothetical protein
MTQDTYRFAYEEANAELQEILNQFERLRLRKTQMELVVEALQPLLSDVPQITTAAEVRESESVPFLVQQTAEIAPAPMTQAEPVPVPVPVAEAYEEPEMVEESSDPFQRRIDNALRQGFGGRDSRVLSLGLNGLLTRA